MKSAKEMAKEYAEGATDNIYLIPLFAEIFLDGMKTAEKRVLEVIKKDFECHGSITHPHINNYSKWIEYKLGFLDEEK